jgi:hypothetical protein
MLKRRRPDQPAAVPADAPCGAGGAASLQRVRVVQAHARTCRMRA